MNWLTKSIDIDLHSTRRLIRVMIACSRLEPAWFWLWPDKIDYIAYVTDRNGDANRVLSWGKWWLKKWIKSIDWLRICWHFPLYSDMSSLGYGWKATNHRKVLCWENSLVATRDIWCGLQVFVVLQFLFVFFDFDRYLFFS